MPSRRTQRRPRRLRFVKLDVFTRRSLAGNQLAVFPDARGLSDSEMQSLAREMRLPETTCVFPRSAEVERKEGIKVRIFTVEEELPFAGHPTLGTAFFLRGKSQAKEIVLDLRVGKVPVRFSRRDGAVFGEMQQPDPDFGRMHDPASVASAIGLSPDDLDSSLPIQTVSTGLAYTIVPFRRLKVLRELQLAWSSITNYMKKSDAKFFYLVSRETQDSNATLHARMIFYGGEDPATGSAAGCATAWMVQHGVLASEQQGMIEQGLEIHRPSQIYVRAHGESNRVTRVRVGGHVVEVMRGEVRR